MGSTTATICDYPSWQRQIRVGRQPKAGQKKFALFGVGQNPILRYEPPREGPQPLYYVSRLLKASHMGKAGREEVIR